MGLDDNGKTFGAVTLASAELPVTLALLVNSSMVTEWSVSRLFFPNHLDVHSPYIVILQLISAQHQLSKTAEDLNKQTNKMISTIRLTQLTSQ